MKPVSQATPPRPRQSGPRLDGAMVVDDEAFAEAALQGMRPFASSDDNGSACRPQAFPANGVPASGAPLVSYPAASPYVVAVGGTNLFTNANYTYNQEAAWEASGGGVSQFETSPFWQAYTGSGTAPIVPSTEVGDRGVPDVAMCAGGTGLAICSAITYVSGATELTVEPVSPRHFPWARGRALKARTATSSASPLRSSIS
jgi:pseudomonalisin